MAIIKFINNNATLKTSLNYVMKEEKTENKLISGKDCIAENAYNEMKSVKKYYDKLNKGRDKIHFIQSFSPNDNLTYEQAHEIGMKMAEYFKGFQVVVATHIDKKHLHNHIIINSVNFENGKIDSLVIGIGINCFPGSFPPEIADKAGTLAQDPSEFRRSMLAAEVINEVLALIDVIETREFFKEYRKRCFILGRPIRIHPNYNDIGIPAAALDIADDGGLIVEYTDGIDKGKRETLHTGEISISIGH